MVINLPDGAEKAWFQDDEGIMREGFIMPDGSAYMIDKYSKTVRVNLKKHPKPTKFGEPLTRHGGESETYEPYEPEEENNGNIKYTKKSNRSKIITGCIILVAILGLLLILLSLVAMQNASNNSRDASQQSLSPQIITPYPTPVINQIVGIWKPTDNSVGVMPLDPSAMAEFDMSGQFYTMKIWPDGTHVRYDDNDMLNRFHGTWKINPSKPNSYFLTFYYMGNPSDQYNAHIDNGIFILDSDSGPMPKYQLEKVTN